MIEFDAPVNMQGRFTASPANNNTNPPTPIVLDPNAFTVTVVSGPGTFGYNPDTNGLVFLPPDDAEDLPITEYLIEVDAQPGLGVVVLPETVRMRAVPLAATALNASVSLESKGTAA